MPDKPALKKLREDLINLGDAFLQYLATHRRPIAEFLDLFLTEAFIARQGD
jgi:hypothetical protein